MGYQDRRGQQGPDYVQMWFGWKIFLVLTRILGAGLFVLFLIGWVIVYNWAPAYGSDYILWVLIACVLAIPALVIVGLWQAFRKRPDPMRNWAPPGALLNPEGPWLDDQGNRLWKRVGDRWERTTVLSRDK